MSSSHLFQTGDIMLTYQDCTYQYMYRIHHGDMEFLLPIGHLSRLCLLQDYIYMYARTHTHTHTYVYYSFEITTFHPIYIS